MKKILCYFLLSIAISGCSLPHYKDIGNGQFTTQGWDSAEADKHATAYCKGKGKSRVVEKLTPPVNPNFVVGQGLSSMAYLTFSCK
jgi:hypothetical protein